MNFNTSTKNKTTRFLRRDVDFVIKNSKTGLLKRSTPVSIKIIHDLSKSRKKICKIRIDKHDAYFIVVMC